VYGAETLSRRQFVLVDEDPLKVRMVQNQKRSRHSERTVRTNRSATPLACGARNGVPTTSSPAAAEHLVKTRGELIVIANQEPDRFRVAPRESTTTAALAGRPKGRSGSACTRPELPTSVPTPDCNGRLHHDEWTPMNLR
jgi:hypothetical protein